MKIYVHYEEHSDEALHKTSKLTVPASWASKSVAEVIQLFVDAYNKKNPGNELRADAMHLENSSGERIYSNASVEEALADRADYFLRSGAHVRSTPAASVASSAAAGAKDAGQLRCKNFGCGAWYTEAENHDEACRHHTGPPMFHDRVKFWTCCPDRKAYEWDEFQQIRGCNIGRHSEVPPAEMFGASPTVAAAAAAEAKSQQQLKSIDDFNKANADAPTSISSAKKSQTNRKSTRQADGTARCLHKGCNKTFNVAENAPNACSFHVGDAVFHDAVKYWTCCPDRKCYDFDEFMRVPGCARGYHDDGTDEFPVDPIAEMKA